MDALLLIVKGHQLQVIMIMGAGDIQVIILLSNLNQNLNFI